LRQKRPRELLLERYNEIKRVLTGAIDDKEAVASLRNVQLRYYVHSPARRLSINLETIVDVERVESLQIISVKLQKEVREDGRRCCPFQCEVISLEDVSISVPHKHKHIQMPLPP